MEIKHILKRWDNACPTLSVRRRCQSGAVQSWVNVCVSSPHPQHSHQ